MSNVRERRQASNTARRVDDSTPEAVSTESNFFYRTRYHIFTVWLVFSFAICYSILNGKSLNPIFFKHSHPRLAGWQVNRLLSEAESLDLNGLKGPDAIEFDQNGSLYTGLCNGQIVRIDPDKHIEKIIQVGDEMDQRICDNVKKEYIACPPCGRPYGIRMKPNTPYLYVADSFYGIVKVDVRQKSKSIIIHSNDTRFGDKPLRSTEDLDIDGDTIYFVDSSYKHDLNEAVEDIVYGFPGGRLFSYNEKTDELKLIADKLFHPNGVQLLPNKSAVLVNEYSTGRILTFGIKSGEKSLFATLPGMSEAIRLTRHNTLLVPFVKVVPESSSLLSWLGKLATFRAIASYIISPDTILNLWPRYGLVAEFDLNGHVIRSWHDPEGKRVGSVTTAVFYDNKLYLGSYQEDHILIIPY